jgi:hypothetical protein
MDMSTPQGLELHLDLYRKQEQVLLLWKCLQQTLKKRLIIFPCPAGMSVIKHWPARESLVSDIPAGDGKIDNLFFTVKRPVLSMYVSTQRGPELHLECVYTPEATSASGLVWKQKPVLILDLPTPKRPVLHLDVSKLLRPVRLLELSTPQYRGLSSTWTYLDKSSLHVLVLLRCLHRKDLSCRWTSLHWKGLYCS